MIRRLVNLRPHGYALNFADDAMFNEYFREFEEMRQELTARGVRYGVAPRCTLTLPDGRVLQPGTEVTAAMFPPIRVVRDAYSETHVPPYRQLQDHVRAGRVIESDFSGPEAA